METDIIVDRLFEEAGAGDGAYAYFFRQPFAEGKVILHSELADIHHDIVGALGDVVGQADFVQAAAEKIPLSGVESQQLVIIFLAEAESCHDGFLQGSCGAYGQEIKQTLHSVCVYDCKDNCFKHMMADELDLGYRHSIFNTGDGVGRYFITSVTVELHKNWLKPPFYTSLQAYFDERGTKEFTPQVVRDAVAEIRASKLPDPAEFASAGSFFKNVYIKEEEIPAAEAKGIPVWDGGKIPSGWLIEHAGLKGKEFFGMRVSDKAALVLINESAKSYADLAKARQAVIDAVYEKFGYKLEQEPMELGK